VYKSYTGMWYLCTIVHVVGHVRPLWVLVVLLSPIFDNKLLAWCGLPFLGGYRLVLIANTLVMSTLGCGGLKVGSRVEYYTEGGL
jgi:hypothetical protein